MNNHEQEYALVTGSSTGIGRAIARELAGRNYNLILNSLPGQNLEQVGNDIRNEFHVDVIYHESDLIKENGPLDLFNFVRSRKCNLSILVNNAGIGFDGPLENYDPGNIDLMILLNIRALTLLTYYFTPDLKDRKKSYILFLGSFGSFLPTAFKSVYLATKSYIFYLARALDSEFTGTSISTCVIVPSAVATNPETLDRIKRGGWFGKKSVLDPGFVAKKGVTKMFRGDKVVIPGFMTNLIFRAGKFLPEGLLMYVTRRIFSNYN